MAPTRDEDSESSRPASAYEGRTDSPASDTDAGRRGPAAGAGVTTPATGASHDEVSREGGGSEDDREQP
jgi:hypothetical protein